MGVKMISKKSLRSDYHVLYKMWKERENKIKSLEKSIDHLHKIYNDSIYKYYKDFAYVARRRIKDLEKDNTKQQVQIAETRQENLTLKQQLQCAAKGHNFVFTIKSLGAWVEYKYQFKCSNCDLTITKTLDELTTKEKKALIDLKILEESDAKTTKTKTTN